MFCICHHIVDDSFGATFPVFCLVSLTPVHVRWISLDDGTSRAGLYLSSVKVGDLGLLDDSVQVRLPFFFFLFSSLVFFYLFLSSKIHVNVFGVHLDTFP